MTALPTPNMERWKYTNPSQYVSAQWPVRPGRVQCDLDKDYLSTSSDNQLWGQEEHNDLDLWSGFQNLLSVTIPQNVSVEGVATLTLETVAETQNQGHIYICLEEGASLTLFENTVGSGWCNRSMTIFLRKGANLTHIRLAEGSDQATCLTQVECAENASYNAYALQHSRKFVRDQYHVRLTGKNARCDLSGAKILSGQEHCDTTILIDHMAPDCYSNQNYRNLLNGSSRGVFQGKVFVDQIAQRTDGYQLCNTIMLSDKCEMDTKPELEIYADDVKCSHGATTAQPDEDPLFYMQARGIPKNEAQRIMMQSFLSESLDALQDEEAIYEQLSQKISDALAL